MRQGKAGVSVGHDTSDLTPPQAVVMSPISSKQLSIRNKLLALAWTLFLPFAACGGNFYAGTSPANVPWPGGVVPYEFTNTLTTAQQQTYLDGLHEWQLAANVSFVPHTTETRWILFAYNTDGFDNVSPDYNPQVVSVSSLSRAQVYHEMGHSFGFTHENIRSDQANCLTILTNNIYNEPANIVWFTIDPTSVTNGAYDFESVMHLGWDFASMQTGVLATQQPKPPYFPRYQYRMGNLCLSPGDRAALQYLYGPPAVPLTNIVTTTADAGPGSLRASLYYVTDHPGSVVKFNIPASDAGYSNGVFNIHLSGLLPPLASNGMVIDGSTQPGFTSNPLIVVDGSQIIPETFTSNSGLLIYSASNQVKNISFRGFNWNGLTLEFADATNNTIAGCWLGLDATGSNAAPNAYQGILFVQGASRNIIGGTNTLARNVISGNSQYGLWMSDTNTTGNVILGNYIGTDASGSLAVPNALGGIGIFYNGVGHIIGGTNADGRNVISGNGGAGIWIDGTGVSNNILRGNFIGLNAAGTAGVSNAYGTGVTVAGGASGNAILNNVISSNYIGVVISDAGTSRNVIQGNLIGTDTTGKAALPNGYEGLAVQGGAASNTIGGTTASSANVISGNYYNLAIFDPGTSGNVIQGNLIGVDITGKTALPGQYQGVAMGNGASSNIIGGTVAGSANIISGNYLGLVIGNAYTSGNLFQGNLIGTDITGTNALGNGFADVQLYGGASGNFIGGVAPGAGNTIAFSGFGPGVVLYDPGTTNNAIRGNSIYSNGGLGIDLNNDGVTFNHTGFLAGPNNLQNFPVITIAFGYASSTIIQGTLNSTANGSFLIDVYRNIAADPSGYGEGQLYAGTVSVTTDGSGNATFALTNNTGNYAGQYFTATATSSGGDTSEFGMDVVATNQTAPSALFSGPFVAGTSGFSFTLTLQTNFSYRIQATTNLGTIPIPWVDLTNFTPTTSLLIFTDRTATNYGARFYRVVSP